METLPDHLAAGLDLVFVGLNPSTYSVEVGHYFANPRNRFWEAFNRSGLVPDQLSPARDDTLLGYGIGLTDVVKRPTSQGSGLTAADFRRWAPVLKEKLEHYQPRVACFHGMVAYRSYLWHGEQLRLGEGVLGPQDHSIGRSRVFVVPNPSPANARYSVADLADWYRQLGRFVEETKKT